MEHLRAVLRHRGTGRPQGVLWCHGVHWWCSCHSHRRGLALGVRGRRIVWGLRPVMDFAQACQPAPRRERKRVREGRGGEERKEREGRQGERGGGRGEGRDHTS